MKALGSSGLSGVQKEEGGQPFSKTTQSFKQARGLSAKQQPSVPRLNLWSLYVNRSIDSCNGDLGRDRGKTEHNQTRKGEDKAELSPPPTPLLSPGDTGQTCSGGGTFCIRSLD
ncbi:hypothetical protein E5288_WYG009618 [Bos mutus]|uniref:Uncharacterized protein n=1 Tax=Bos mutus TaxID=72004 RepID=A0A6B0R240_9CETA|nr:hypothetical protein [Bos mutus]